MGADLKSFGSKLNKGVIAFSNNVIIKTIASGMARLLPVTIVGSIATLLVSLPFDPYLNFIKSTGISKFLLLGSTMTNDIISIYLVIALSYEMARLYKKSQINSVVTALLAFFLVTPMTSAMIGEKAKSKQLKAIGQVAIVPGVFGISEPMKFGIPMVYNPLIFIPMAMTPVVSVTIAYLATVIGFLPRVGVNIPWSMPPIISGLLAGGWKGAFIQIIQFIVCILIYIPFFKAMDKQKMTEESKKEGKA